MAGEAALSARFETPEDARRAVDELRLAGFGADQIDLDEGDSRPVESGAPEEVRGRRPPLLTVHTDGRLLEAATLLHRYGGRDAVETMHVEHRSVPPPGLVLELREEELRPRVVPVQVGEVSVRKVVVSETRTIEVQVRHEEVVVEHLPAPTQAIAPAGAPLATTEEEVIRIPVYAEEVEVVKRPVVREEVVIRKRRLPTTRTVEAEARREEPRVRKKGRGRLKDLTTTG